MSEDKSHEWAKEAAEDAERLWQISMAEMIAALQQFEIAQPETRVVFDAERRRLQHFVDKLIAAKPQQMAAINWRVRSARLYANPVAIKIGDLTELKIDWSAETIKKALDEADAVKLEPHK